MVEIVEVVGFDVCVVVALGVVVVVVVVVVVLVVEVVGLDVALVVRDLFPPRS